jgi:hypothetical protein
MTKEQAKAWAAVRPVTVVELIRRLLQSTDDQLHPLLREEPDRRQDVPEQRYATLWYSLRKAVKLRLNAPSDVDDDLLARLEQRMLGSVWEANAWRTVLLHLPRSLPLALAHRLIDRNVAVDDIGRRWEDEEILWRLAPIVDEALLTLAKHRYQSPDESIDRLREVFDRYPTHTWMLELLTLTTPSDAEKRKLLVQYLRRHPDPDLVARYAPELLEG